MRLADFDFDLPPDLIAQHPPAQRSASRLLEVRADALIDRQFSDLRALVLPGDLLVMNDTRVLKARLLGRKRATGGAVEALVERVLDPAGAPEVALAQLRASKTPVPGTRLVFGSAQAEVLGREGEFFRLRFDEPVATVLEREGRLPLPPYIEHQPDAEDERRYQTVYARQPGAVAAPTAGLHFDEQLLAALRARGVELACVTLHVGAGTFQPVRVDDLAQHQMHSEWYRIDPSVVTAIDSARARGARVIAVGTTSLRALESAAQADGTVLAGSRETSLFITPGYTFRVVDRLITNFHLPRSTLLMLVAAFAGHARVKQAYAHAIDRRYRFFSYGDAMLLSRDG